jgi:hypothetical protein
MAGRCAGAGEFMFVCATATQAPSRLATTSAVQNAFLRAAGSWLSEILSNMLLNVGPQERRGNSAKYGCAIRRITEGSGPIAPLPLIYGICERRASSPQPSPPREEREKT